MTESQFEQNMLRAFYFVHSLESKGCRIHVSDDEVYIEGYVSIEELAAMRDIKPFFRLAAATRVGHA